MSTKRNRLQLTNYKGRAGEHSDIDMAIFSKNVTDDNRLDVMADAIALISKYKNTAI
jgi:hypothetical protein